MGGPFGTMTRDLLASGECLKERGVSHVAMDSTGVFWKPVYSILEGHFELLLSNARQIKNVPGRETDVKDAEWIAQMLRQYFGFYSEERIHEALAYRTPAAVYAEVSCRRRGAACGLHNELCPPRGQSSQQPGRSALSSTTDFFVWTMGRAYEFQLAATDFRTKQNLPSSAQMPN